MKSLLCCLTAILVSAGNQTRADEPVAQPTAQNNHIVVIPIREQITPPELFILRRGLKLAIDQGADTVILDMETPGGRLDVTFDILKALERFPGKTITYVNTEAISAGALISAGTDEIHFAPGSIIGAAAPVIGGGQEIDKTMQAKIVSYLKARVRAMSENERYRGEVVSAMIDIRSVFTIDEEVIKSKDELLTLTATEAIKTYGDPPVPLLGAGISPTIEDLMDSIHGAGNYQVTRLEITWSEKTAQYLTVITPLLLAAGLLLIFIEFKTPGFGIFGIMGGIILAVVFFGHNAAGLSGHEPALFFLLGLALVLLELFLFPGILVLAIPGIILMLGSLLWGMSDIWPDQPIEWNSAFLTRPLANLLSGTLLAIVAFVLMVRFLPQGGLWGKMILETSIQGYNPTILDRAQPSLLGQQAIAVTGLYPSGQIEVDGKRYDARVTINHADPGTPVRIIGHGEFELKVETIA